MMSATILPFAESQQLWRKSPRIFRHPELFTLAALLGGHWRFLNLSSCPLCFLHMKVTFKCLALRFHLGPLTVTFFSEAMESTSERGLLEANSAKTFYLTPPNHIMKLKQEEPRIMTIFTPYFNSASIRSLFLSAKTERKWF